jgi:hypothetical protein
MFTFADVLFSLPHVSENPNRQAEAGHFQLPLCPTCLGMRLTNYFTDERTIIMASSYYINQGSSDFKDISFGTTTIGSSGCGICCIAMVICRKAGVTTVAGKKGVIQAIINNGLSGNLLLNSSTIPYSNQNYSVSTTTSKPSSYSNTIIQYNGHYVLAVNNTTAEDPGSSAVTTVSGADNNYGAHKKYWLVN